MCMLQVVCNVIDRVVAIHEGKMEGSLEQALCDDAASVLIDSSALHACCEKPAPDVALLLLQAGADPWALNEDGLSPLEVALENGPLHSSHASMMVPSFVKGSTDLLHGVLAMQNPGAVLEILRCVEACLEDNPLEVVALVTQTNTQGEAPLLCAVRDWSSEPEVAMLLLKMRADPVKNVVRGLSPMRIALQSADALLVNGMLEARLGGGEWKTEDVLADKDAMLSTFGAMLTAIRQDPELPVEAIRGGSLEMLLPWWDALKQDLASKGLSTDPVCCCGMPMVWWIAFFRKTALASRIGAQHTPLVDFSVDGLTLDRWISCWSFEASESKSTVQRLAQHGMLCDPDSVEELSLEHSDGQAESWYLRESSEPHRDPFFRAALSSLVEDNVRCAECPVSDRGVRKSLSQCRWVSALELHAHREEWESRDVKIGVLGSVWVWSVIASITEPRSYFGSRNHLGPGVYSVVLRGDDGQDQVTDECLDCVWLLWCYAQRQPVGRKC